MTNSEQAIREIAKKWELTQPDLEIWKAEGKIVHVPIPEFLSDLTALISEHYYPKEKYDELLQQRDELKDSLVDMVNQFAYRGTYEGRENMHTGGLSALEDAFAALGLSDPITLIDFYAAIKNTER